MKSVSGYADEKIAVLEDAIDQGEAELVRLDAQLYRAPADASAGFLVLRRGELFDQLVTHRRTSRSPEEVQRSSIVEEAVARKVTAQSRRNQVVVGAFLGLLLGLAAALLWESALALRRR